jgi:hypothetical protein
VRRYFHFAMPTYRFLHQATVERWLERLYDERDTVEVKGRLLADGKAAVVLTVLATSTLYWVDEAGSVHDVDSRDCEQRYVTFWAVEATNSYSFLGVACFS